MEPLHLETVDNDFVRRCVIKRIDDNIQVNQKELWFKFTKTTIPPADDDCDSYLLGILMDAMKEERQIIVQGSVSKQLLSNLVEYQAVWNSWYPNLFKLVDIKVNKVRDSKVPVDGTICPFSGGVDGAFSVWRHVKGKVSYRTQKIDYCSFIHGFDIDPSDIEIYNKTKNSVIETLNDVNIKFLPLKTNFRLISSVPWVHAYACCLIASLSNFKNIAGTCIIPSSVSYNNPMKYSASNAITDPLLNSDEFNIIHDGASIIRVNKINQICQWKKGIENLRVCWSSNVTNFNCGKCEKCVRTKLNFLVSGNPIPDIFPPNFNIEDDIKKVVLNKVTVRNLWEEILEQAKQNNINEKWVSLARKALRKKPLNHYFFPKQSNRRKFVKNLITRTKSFISRKI